MRTEMDYLVLQNFLLAKDEQPHRERDESWQEEFGLD
jgi:carbamoyltransferase